MSTPRDTPNALSDITNITDDARQTREEWNLRRRVRRAEMSEEQQEEARRKGREYQRQRRERQRAESQNIGAPSSVPGTNHDTTSENFSLLLDKENVQPTEDGDHIHGVIGTTITIGSRLTVDSGSHNFSMDQRSQIVLNDDNTGPTAVGNHSHAGLDIEGIANTSMDKRNTQQRKRRAEMTVEQLEAKRRKNAEYQRQYRARKKAELQHANNTSNDNQANVGASSQYGLPPITDVGQGSIDMMREIREEQNVSVPQEHLDIFDSLNKEQREGFEEIIEHVFSNKSQVFFVDGPGGTGKTFLYKALLARVRSKGLIAIATATSGIAASILPGGRTAHSRFKIPINIREDSTCTFSKQGPIGELLRRASLIIWDEVAMTKRQCVECLDRSLRDVMECALPFGGKVMVFGGDFRQVLPVVPRGSRAQVTNACLKRSYLWPNIRQIRLTQNMRAQSDPMFSEYLLRIGNGTEKTIGDDYVRLPDEIVIGYTDTDVAINQLIQDIFPSLEDHATSTTYMSSRAILSTKNEYVDQLNAMMIEIFPGEEKVYHSFDTVVDDPSNHFPLDFLNSITPNGLPPHELKLKINCPVILLRNLDPNNGLCNGTRLVVRALQDNAIDAEITGGQHVGKRVFIPRLPLSPSDDISLPFKFRRKQFPVRLSFAMTINKSQGQTIPNVGIYLPEPVFSHGQLYVGLSRGVSRNATRVLAKPKQDLDPTGRSTRNIVYRDVLN